jgi:hypothetical protein
VVLKEESRMSSSRVPNGETAQPAKSKAQQKKEETQQKRSHQLTDARVAAEKLGEDLKAARLNLRLCNELIDHSSGFYEEVNKLAKGKTPFPATSLVSDAKKLIKAREDIHMGRIKEFVPAGGEPLYPDVLVIIRSVRDCLKRHKERQSLRVNTLQNKLRVAATAIGALEYVLNDEEASEAEREAPPREVVRAYTNGATYKDCFASYSDYPNPTEYYFDFEKLDAMTFEEYLSTIVGDAKEEEDLTENDSDEMTSDAAEAEESEDDEE